MRRSESAVTVEIGHAPCSSEKMPTVLEAAETRVATQQRQPSLVWRLARALLRIALAIAVVACLWGGWDLDADCPRSSRDPCRDATTTAISCMAPGSSASADRVSHCGRCLPLGRLVSRCGLSSKQPRPVSRRNNDSHLLYGAWLERFCGSR